MGRISEILDFVTLFKESKRSKTQRTILLFGLLRRNNSKAKVEK